MFILYFETLIVSIVSLKYLAATLIVKLSDIF